MEFGIKNIFLESTGLIRIKPTVKVSDNYTLSLVYTPGVGHICKVIEKDPDQLYDLTIAGRSIALIADGSRLNINKPDETIPILESTSALFKSLFNLDAYPLALNRTLVASIDDYILIADNLSPTYKTIVLLDVEKSKAEAINQALEAAKLQCTVVIADSNDLLQLTKVGALAKAIVESRAILTPKQLSVLFQVGETVDISQLPTNLVSKLTQLYSELLNQIFKQSWQHRTIKDSAEKYIKLFNNFFIYGEQVYLKDWNKGHLLQQNDINQNSLFVHQRYNGMITVETKFNCKSLEQLFNMYKYTYANGELESLRQEIVTKPNIVDAITFKRNYAAIITNGTAILGLGNIGPSAGLPVMEGKSVLFNSLGGIDLIPICLKEKNPHKLVQIIQMISPIFSAINLEDLRAPDCFPIEKEAIETMSMPIMHDDQHGTAVIALAAIINSLRLLKKDPKDLKLLINGAGAAGVAICKLLHGHGILDVIICDTQGAIYEGRENNMNELKVGLTKFTNPNKIQGPLTEAIKGRNVFIGVSAAGALTKDMVKSMSPNPIIMALANPVPEIYPDEALEAGAFIVATGRSDFNNQVNNSLAFPGIFRGAIDTKAREINLEMKIAAAYAIANSIKESEVNPQKILPGALVAEISANVAKAVAIAAIKSGVARVKVDPELVYDITRKLTIEGYLPKL